MMDCNFKEHKKYCVSYSIKVITISPLVFKFNSIGVQGVSKVLGGFINLYSVTTCTGGCLQQL